MATALTDARPSSITRLQTDGTPNTWTELTCPDWARTVVVSNEGTVDVLIAYSTTNGDAGAVHANDNYVTVGAGYAREMRLSSGGRSRDSLSSIFVASGTASQQLAVEAESI